ncbi:MAG: hypothetical protein ABIP94_05930 [Planctomycetota bacterium]
MRDAVRDDNRRRERVSQLDLVLTLPRQLAAGLQSVARPSCLALLIIATLMGGGERTSDSLSQSKRSFCNLPARTTQAESHLVGPRERFFACEAAAAVPHCKSMR